MNVQTNLLEMQKKKKKEWCFWKRGKSLRYPLTREFSLYSILNPNLDCNSRENSFCCSLRWTRDTREKYERIASHEEALGDPARLTSLRARARARRFSRALSFALSTNQRAILRTPLVVWRFQHLFCSIWFCRGYENLVTVNTFYQTLALRYIEISLYLYFFKDEHGDDSAQEKIKKKMPRRVKKRRKVQTDDGVSNSVMGSPSVALSHHAIFLFSRQKYECCRESIQG